MSTDTLSFIPRWLSLEQAARYVNMSGKTLMNYVKTGQIYGTLKGRKWFVDRESIDAWMEEDKLVLYNLKNRARRSRH